MGRSCLPTPISLAFALALAMPLLWHGAATDRAQGQDQGPGADTAGPGPYIDIHTDPAFEIYRRIGESRPPAALPPQAATPTQTLETPPRPTPTPIPTATPGVRFPDPFARVIQATPATATSQAQPAMADGAVETPTVAPQARRRPQVAVLQFKSNTITPYTLSILTQKLIAEILAHGSVDLLDPATIRKRLSEASMLVDDPFRPPVDSSDYARALGVDYVITGNVADIDNRLFLNAAVYSARQDTVAAGDTRMTQSRNATELLETLSPMALRFEQVWSGRPATDGQPEAVAATQAIPQTSAPTVVAQARPIPWPTPQMTPRSATELFRDRAPTPRATPRPTPQPTPRPTPIPTPRPTPRPTPQPTPQPVETVPVTPAVAPTSTPAIAAPPTPTPTPTTADGPDTRPAAELGIPIPEVSNREIYERALAAPMFDPRRFVFFDYLVDQDPENLEYRRHLSHAAYLEGLKGDQVNASLMEKAIANCNYILSREPEDSNTLTVKGIALYNLTRYDESISTLRRALMHDPNNVQAQFNLAFALQMVDAVQAANEFRKYLQMTDGMSDQETWRQHAREWLETAETTARNP